MEVSLDLGRTKVPEARHQLTVYAWDVKSVFQASLSSFAKMRMDNIIFSQLINRDKEKNILEAFDKL